MKRLISLFILLVLILTVFTGCNGKEATVEEYNELKEGMSYAEAAKIIGTKGEIVYENKIDNYNTVIYNWEGKDEAYISATFINDKLTIKEKYKFD